jgi:hypothetical protein
LDAAGGRIDGIASNVWFLLQSKWKKNMETQLMSFMVDLFDFEDEAPSAAKGFPHEVDGLAHAGRTFGLSTFYLDIGPIRIAFPLHEVLPHQLNRGCDDGGGTDC